MSLDTLSSAAPASSRISTARLIILLGAAFGLGSLGIDAALPALTLIGHDMKVADLNQVQWIITIFGFGMGIGNLFGGPLSDIYGRNRIIALGCLMYGCSAIMAACATSLEWIVLARLVQGIGATFTTVAATALVRDLYSGSSMAKIMSFSMMVFAMMPAVAPLLGKTLVMLSGWHAIFYVFAVFALSLMVYGVNTVKAPAEIHKADSDNLISRIGQVMAFPSVRGLILSQTMSMAMLFSILASIQPIFERVYARGDTFALYFAFLAMAIAVAGFLNGKFVERIGSARILKFGFKWQICVSTLGLVLLYSLDRGSNVSFYVFLMWAACTFFGNGLTMGNVNAMAMEPVGHLAGVASSLIASIPMIVGTLIAVPVGLAFNGTPLPLVASVLAQMIIAGVTAHLVFSTKNSDFTPLKA